MLTNKNVLLIAPKFFDYEIEIKKAIEELGAVVDYIDERPKNDFFTKASIRLDLKFIIRKNINKHFDTILKKISYQQYDYILFVNPETVTESFIAKMKEIQENAKFILYMWDSVKNKTGTVKIKPYFDRALTFDTEDVNEFKRFEFLPLFYIPRYKDIETPDTYKYDLCFIGTAHGDRYKIIKEIEKQADEVGLKFYSFLYLPSRILFYVKKYITKELKDAPREDFSFLPLSYEVILEKIANSKVIVDIESPHQVGLTMRTIEMLGAKKKMLTTNLNVIDYDFFKKENISLLDRNDIVIDMNFMNLKYKSIDTDVYDKYSISCWAKSIFSEISSDKQDIKCINS